AVDLVRPREPRPALGKPDDLLIVVRKQGEHADIGMAAVEVAEVVEHEAGLEFVENEILGTDLDDGVALVEHGERELVDDGGGHLGQPVRIEPAGCGIARLDKLVDHGRAHLRLAHGASSASSRPIDRVSRANLSKLGSCCSIHAITSSRILSRQCGQWKRPSPARTSQPVPLALLTLLPCVPAHGQTITAHPTASGLRSTLSWSSSHRYTSSQSTHLGSMGKRFG